MLPPGVLCVQQGRVLVKRYPAMCFALVCTRCVWTYKRAQLLRAQVVLGGIMARRFVSFLLHGRAPFILWVHRISLGQAPLLADLPLDTNPAAVASLWYWLVRTPDHLHRGAGREVH